MEKKKLLKKRIILLCCSATLLVVNMILYSLGWFTSDKENSTNGIGMDSENIFNLKTNLDINENNPQKDYENSIENTLLEYMNTVGNGFVNQDGQTVTDEEKDLLIWNLSSNNNLQNLSGNSASRTGIKPGSSGVLRFWVTDNEKEVTLRFYIDIKSYIPQSDLKTDEEEKAEQLNKQVIAEKYLKTHLMFFQKYENNTYSDMINPDEDGTLVIPYKTFEAYDENNPDKNIVELFWIWPESFGQVLLKSGDPNLQGLSPVFDDNNTQKAEYLEKLKYFSNDSVSKGIADNFFYVDNENSTELKKSLDILDCYDSNSEKFIPVYYGNLCDVYNLADQLIGNDVYYVILQLNAEYTEKPSGVPGS